MTTTMRIERVSDTGENLEAATSLIDAAGEWLRTKDTDQWAEPWPSRKERDERVRRDLAAGKTWFVRDEDAGDALAATVTVAKDPIPFVWKAARPTWPSRPSTCTGSLLRGATPASAWGHS